MATREEARTIWESVAGQFKKTSPFRIAYMGDGRGTSRSNMYTDRSDTIVYARDSLTEKNFFTVLNKRVNPIFNLPVILGYDDTDPATEQILGIHWATLELITSPVDLGGLEPHHTQHEFGGGDEVFIDSRLFKPGLVMPTDPPSMIVTVLSFAYYYNGWRYFAQTNSDDLTQYIPTSGNRYVSICLDPEIDTLVYRIGEVFSLGQTWEDLLTTTTTDDYIPAPAGGEMPLVALYLTDTTTTLDWNENGTDNILDTRFHIGTSDKNILDRLDQLEGITGNASGMMMLGVANVVTDDEQVIDGGFWS